MARSSPVVAGWKKKWTNILTQLRDWRYVEAYICPIRVLWQIVHTSSDINYSPSNLKHKCLFLLLFCFVSIKVNGGQYCMVTNIECSLKYLLLCFAEESHTGFSRGSQVFLKVWSEIRRTALSCYESRLSKFQQRHSIHSRLLAVPLYYCSNWPDQIHFLQIGKSDKR